MGRNICCWLCVKVILQQAENAISCIGKYNQEELDTWQERIQITNSINSLCRPNVFLTGKIHKAEDTRTAETLKR